MYNNYAAALTIQNIMSIGCNTFIQFIAPVLPNTIALHENNI